MPCPLGQRTSVLRPAPHLGLALGDAVCGHPWDPTATPGVNLSVPEACPGACSQLPRSGIWTPLYNLPKGKKRLHSPSAEAAAAVAGRAFSQEEVSGPHSYPPTLGSSGGPVTKNEAPCQGHHAYAEPLSSAASVRRPDTQAG